MTAGEPPQLDADGHLDGRRGEVLLLLAGLQLHQHLVELSGESVSLRVRPRGSAPATRLPPVTWLMPSCAQHLKLSSRGLCLLPSVLPVGARGPARAGFLLRASAPSTGWGGAQGERRAGGSQTLLSVSTPPGAGQQF